MSLISRSYLFVFILLAPAKFGSVVNSTGVGFYPLSLSEWLVAPWPPFLAPVFSSIALLLAALAGMRRMSSPGALCSRTLYVFPVALLPATLIGLIHTTEWDTALLFVWHIVGMINFVGAVALNIATCERSRGVFLVALAGGTILSVSSGLYQVKYGFEETRVMALKMAQAEQRKLSPAMQSRLSQRRAFATFTYPNNYAAHLILTLPLTLAMMWRFGGHFHPEQASRIVLTAFVAVPGLSVLFYTGSRSAVAALFMSCLLTAAAFYRRLPGASQPRRTRAIVGVAVMVAAVAVLAVYRGRSFASVEARGLYYWAAWKMFLAEPVFGVGMGEFFTYYMRLKPPGAEETRLAHNLFLHFLSQCGMIGGLAAVGFLFQPLIAATLFLRQRAAAPSNGLLAAGVIGAGAWSLHALTDFNIQIPVSVYFYAAMPLLVLAPLPRGNSAQSAPTIPRRYCVMVIGLAVAGLYPLCRADGEHAYQLFHNRARSLQRGDLMLRDVRETATKLPLSAYPWDLYGKIQLTRGDYSMAIQAFEEASKRAPHRAAYHAYLAQCYFAVGDVERARARIAQAVYWYPHHPDFKRLQTQFSAD